MMVIPSSANTQPQPKPPGQSEQPKLQVLGALAPNKWKTFADFENEYFSRWVVLLPKDKNAWLNGSCSCPFFFLNYKCKHIVGLAIRNQSAEAPIEAKLVPIGQKRRRGRPSKARSALVVQ